MANSFDVFCRTIQIGERLFCLPYSDYHDAYVFSAQYHSEMSDRFLNCFDSQLTFKKVEHELELIRYFLIKAIEQRIVSDLYANTLRSNACDVLWSPVDLSLERYPTNLPKHLENIVNSKQKDAFDLASAIIQELKSDRTFFFGREVLNAVQFIGHMVGYNIGQKNSFYKGYSCSDMLTRNELNEIAGINLCKWLKSNGFKVENANFSRDTYQNIIATKESQKVFILLSAEVIPEDPSFTRQDLDDLYHFALQNEAIPYYASVSLGSTNDAHFNDGVLLFGDQAVFKINTIEKLEIE